MNASVAIILVEPENPDNIGAAARAMKNMGFSDLRLVKPRRGWKLKAKKMAVAAYPLVQKATVFESLEAAIQDQNLVIGTTRRQGSRRGTIIPFKQTLQLVYKKSLKWKKAFVFGKESKGLSNRDMDLCDWLTTIDCDESFPSLNLAQAVMVVCYSIFSYKLKKKNQMDLDGLEVTKSILNSSSVRVDKKEAREVLYEWHKSLIALGYEREGAQTIDRIVRSFHRMIKRTGLLRSEAKMFKGYTRRILERE